MALKKALYYGAIGLGILIAVTVVVSVVSAVVSLAWAILSGLISLAVLLGLVYAAYRVGAWIFGGSGGEQSIGGEETSEPADATERLRREYVEGRITEAEFERRIETHLGSGATATTTGDRSNDTGDRSNDTDVERELDRLKDE